MATTSASCLAGPVAFKDAFPEGAAAAPVPWPKEYDDIISTLPSNPLGHLQYQGTWVPKNWVPGVIEIQRSFTPRRGDVVLATPPKCGTTWLKALAFATMARGVYPPGAEEHPLRRYNPHDCVPFVEVLSAAGWGSKMDALPSPRLMATHMQHSILPPSIAKNPDCKMVYVFRDPKDMLVSMWHFIRKRRPHVSFSDVFELTCEGRSLSGPIWDHILGYWNASKESPERVLFLKYEEMLQDPISNIRKLAQFLGRPFSIAEEEEGVVMDIVKLCSFEKLKNLEVNKAGTYGVFVEHLHESFFRKGEAGDWVNHMTTEMAQRLDAIFEEKFRGSGLALM